MKTNKLLKFTMAAGIFCAAGLATHADTITTGTTITGGGSNPYGGGGIPYAGNSTVTTISGIGANQATDDTLTLALAATAYGDSNPSPGNPSYGVYTVNTGLVGGRSEWNFDFYIGSALGELANYTFVLTETGINGQTYSFTPLSIPDNAGTVGSSAGNSESLDFTGLGGPIGYNANDAGQYTFTLQAYEGDILNSDTLLGGTTITVNASAVPDNSSTVGLLGAGLIGLICFQKSRFMKTVSFSPLS